MSEKAEIPIPPEPSCEGCSQPQNTDNARFVVSNAKALERYRDQGCPTCPLILQGLEKCLGEEAVSKSDRLLLVFNGYGIRVFHVIVDNDIDKTVSFFVSPGNVVLLFRWELALTTSQGLTRPIRQ
ncbi:hypothetical protein IMZ48_14375 [Candidatus Bathyarchaeota archaeon]|nr:hypothetical protein [Candidatus Bathyarchaeota archaeon]